MKGTLNSGEPDAGKACTSGSEGGVARNVPETVTRSAPTLPTLLPQLPLHTANDPVERAFYHLLRHPYDLVDARWLMLHLHVSPQDIQQAFTLLEQQEPKDAQEREQ